MRIVFGAWPVSGWRARRPAAALVAGLSLSGCATTDGAGWGAEGSFTPGWHHVGDAAVEALTDPFTWAPAVGAAALQIGDLDDDIADWARDEHPVFGSSDAADDASDWLRNANLALYAGIGLAAPVAADESWGRAKMRGFAVGLSTLAVTEVTVNGLKEAVGRDRPLDQNDRSFPSGHTALSASAARLSAEALEDYDISPAAELGADAGLAGLALLTGWARVEAGQHFPADALAGAALANFLAVFATEAFLRDGEEPAVALNVQPLRDGMAVSATLPF